MIQSSFEIETSRLIIREVLLEDERGFFEMDSDSDVHQFVGKRPVERIEQSRDMIAFIKQQYIDNGMARWAVVEKESNEFVGWTGFKLMKENINGHFNFIDFGYRFKRKCWGKGYATESGFAALKYGVEQLNYKDIFAMTDIDNVASKRVLEKLNFKFIHTFKYDGSPIWREAGQETTWYKLKL